MKPAERSALRSRRRYLGSQRAAGTNLASRPCGAVLGTPSGETVTAHFIPRRQLLNGASAPDPPGPVRWPSSRAYRLGGAGGYRPAAGAGRLGHCELGWSLLVVDTGGFQRVLDGEMPHVGSDPLAPAGAQHQIPNRALDPREQEAAAAQAVLGHQRLERLQRDRVHIVDGPEVEDHPARLGTRVERPANAIFEKAAVGEVERLVNAQNDRLRKCPRLRVALHVTENILVRQVAHLGSMRVGRAPDEDQQR